VESEGDVPKEAIGSMAGKVNQAHTHTRTRTQTQIIIILVVIIISSFI